MAVAHVGQRVLSVTASRTALWVQVVAMLALAGSAGLGVFDAALPPRWRVAHGVLLGAALAVIGHALWRGARRPGTRGPD
jgi:hypothetical protein